MTDQLNNNDKKNTDETDIIESFTEELEDIPDNNFRFQNQKTMFTYKTHLNKEEYINWFTKLVSKQCKNIKFIRCAHETGDKSHPYEHTHVVVDLGKCFQTKSVRFFDYLGIHPNIKKLKTDKHYRNSQRYLSKEDPENKDLKNIQCSLAEEIWSYETKAEAFKNVTSLSEVLGTSMLFDMKPIEWMGGNSCKIQSEDDMYSWQRTLYTYTKTPPDDRTVTWIADPKGSNGKNQLIKYCCCNDKHKYIWIPCSGKLNDIMNVLCAEITKGWRGDTIFINLARSATAHSEMKQVYSLLENIKDGMISTTKYNGFRLNESPLFHVIILSNTFPSYNTLTTDRWKVFTINESKELINVKIEEEKPFNFDYMSGIEIK